MHGRPSSVNKKVRSLLSEIRRESQNPFRNYYKMKNLWFRMCKLQHGGAVSQYGAN